MVPSLKTFEVDQVRADAALGFVFRGGAFEALLLVRANDLHHLAAILADQVRLVVVAQSVTTRAAAGGREDARRAVDAAHAAFPGWADAPPAERRALLSAAADLLAERAPAIAATMTEEVGATFGWGMFNCDLAAAHAARGGRPGLRARPAT